MARPRKARTSGAIVFVASAGQNLQSTIGHGRYENESDENLRSNQPSPPPLLWHCGHDHCRRPVRHAGFCGRAIQQGRPTRPRNLLGVGPIAEFLGARPSCRCRPDRESSASPAGRCGTASGCSTPMRTLSRRLGYLSVTTRNEAVTARRHARRRARSRVS